MSRYADMAALALAYTRAQFEQRERCAAFAFELAQRLAAWLEVPQGNLGFGLLDAQLRPTRESVGIQPAAPMQLGQDGRWYFALRLRLELPPDPIFGEITLKIAVHWSGSHFHAKLEEDFEIDPADPAGYDALLDKIYREVVEDYSRAPDQPHKHIGFLGD